MVGTRRDKVGANPLVLQETTKWELFKYNIIFFIHEWAFLIPCVGTWNALVYQMSGILIWYRYLWLVLSTFMIKITSFNGSTVAISTFTLTFLLNDRHFLLNRIQDDFPSRGLHRWSQHFGGSSERPRQVSYNRTTDSGRWPGLDHICPGPPPRPGQMCFLAPGSFQ